jgi:hypothetical protein
MAAVEVLTSKQRRPSELKTLQEFKMQRRGLPSSISLLNGAVLADTLGPYSIFNTIAGEADSGPSSRFINWMWTRTMLHRRRPASNACLPSRSGKAAQR